MSDEKYKGPYRIGLLERLRNTRDGNPSYRVVFTDGTVGTTKENASIAGMLENSEFQDADLMVAFDRPGVIVDVYPLMSDDDTVELRRLSLIRGSGLAYEDRRRMQVLLARAVASKTRRAH